ncbi:PepSY domain-containing protein [Phreatobacter stygius]|uniref:PepSY domain-containing protein n=1 Tax=Phreatobacter stygius TaxID=1940610 RepID=A0A4D7AYV7_9HYPH|nr:PepSY domain-containing protein [Phreatobacter stygius]QCI62860.1 PepSY domain-containing protein [Phreatobacter stygius]
MLLNKLHLALVVTMLNVAPLPLSAARAGDRLPTPEERRQIEQILRGEGFTQWGEIDYGNGQFEVAKAVARDGQRYDLKLSQVDFSIVSRDRDE